MGTYRSHTDELRASGFDLDIVAYEQRDIAAHDPGVRHFMMDPAWHPWLDNGYPPFGEITDPEAEPQYVRGHGHHGSFDLTRAVIATVSKPGGGTLLDSLWSATPTILLKPFGAHEQRNSDLWEHFGFGISLDRWRESGFDLILLEKLHNALDLACQSLPDYSELLAQPL
jgi:hypothetical protein